jgi:hypothetical protein
MVFVQSSFGMRFGTVTPQVSGKPPLLMNWHKTFDAIIRVMSRPSFFMLGAVLVRIWCRLGTKAWKQWTL